MDPLSAVTPARPGPPRRRPRTGPVTAVLAALLMALAACAAPEPPPQPGETPAQPPAPVVTPGHPEADESGFAPGAAHKLVTAHKEMVAAAEPLAARAGLEILHKGGNALDAAIATEMVLTLVEPQSAGIGGGGFLLNFDGKSGEISAYEGREMAPAAAAIALRPASGRMPACAAWPRKRASIR